MIAKFDKNDSNKQDLNTSTQRAQRTPIRVVDDNEDQQQQTSKGGCC